MRFGEPLWVLNPDRVKGIRVNEGETTFPNMLKFINLFNF